MGFVVLAIYAGTLLSLQGLMVQMLAHGLSSAALFIMAGQLYERMHTRELPLMGGMWGQFRYFAPLLMFFCAALLGIPGTGNFIGEFLILLGSFEKYPVYVVIATFSLVWAGLYSLIIIHRALFGKETVPKFATVSTDANTVQPVAQQNHAVQPANATLAVTDVPPTHMINHSYEGEEEHDKPINLYDLNKRELMLLLTLAIGLVWLGLYPQTVLDTSSHAMQWISNAYNYHEVVNFDTVESIQSAVAAAEVR